MEKETPRISVIMGIYNQKDRQALKLAVDSVLKQTFGGFEFLIYDDGSNADDAQFLKELAEKDSRIVLLRGEENKGLAHGLNECIKVAKGEFVARMDGDDICEPNRLEHQLMYLEQHLECAFAGCAAKLFDADGVWGTRTLTEQPGEKEFLKFSPYIHPSVMFRSNVLKEAGGYLEAKETRRCEDYELFMRLYCMGHHGYNMQEVLFSYREDRERYDKRTWKQRVAEMKIRYRGFKAMGILNSKNLIYVVKPVVMVVIPDGLRTVIRKKREDKK